MKRSLLRSCGLALFAAFSVFGSEGAPIPVSTTKPEQRDVAKWIKLPSTIEPDAEVTLYAKVSGYLKDFTLDIGASVKLGEVIGRLDAPELEQDVKYAEAQVAAAQAELQGAMVQVERVNVRGEDIDARQATLEAELLKAKAELARTETQCERTRKLFASNAATQQEKEYLEDSCKILSAAIKTAETKIAALKPEREYWKKDVAAAGAAVEIARGKAGVAQAALERAKVWLSYTELRVPQVGAHAGSAAIITKRFVSNGDLITAAMGTRTAPIITLTVSNPVRVVADLPESSVICVECGTRAQVSFYALGQSPPVPGKITRSSEVLNASTRTLRVEIDLPNPDGKLKPGMMANAEFVVDIHKGVLAAPASSVVIEKQGAYVFTIDGGKAKKLPVKAGFQDHGWTEIAAEGLSQTTSIIKDVRGITDGAAIEIKP